MFVRVKKTRAEELRNIQSGQVVFCHAIWRSCVIADSRANQTTAGIRGRVIDARGEPVKDVSLAATQVDAGFSRNLTSYSVFQRE
jgi:protocatechuate 3,4-dioxygenase beta subunit